MMHSYVYINGEFRGNGFKIGRSRMPEAELLELLSDAGAQTSCAAAKTCEGLLSASKAGEIAATISKSPVALYGWNGCPCTNIARHRFEDVGACYMENVWSDPEDPLMRYLQCKHGSEHHSFVFVGGEFVGNGFQLDRKTMSSAELSSMLDGAGTEYMCQRAGDTNLHGQGLQSCTQSNDGTTTGWTRTGSCNWDPSDSGYHEVCVTMSDTFLANSARHDANDLRSVVSSGGHWCICAWAFAAAVTRDPDDLEGIELDCNRTNGKLREVYEQHISQGRLLHSPSGVGYKAQAALEKVDAICGAPVVGNRQSRSSTGRAQMSRSTARPRAWSHRRIVHDTSTEDKDEY